MKEGGCGTSERTQKPMNGAVRAMIPSDERLWALTDIILQWNEKINVTAVRERKEFFARNVLDSLELAGQPEIEGASSILDLGTGGGFPGLPLAMAYPDKEFVLMDSVGKKLTVVRDAAERLGLVNVRTVHARAEELAADPSHREAFDLVVSRAVANMSTLAEYCMPFVKKGGYFVAYKTVSAAEEIDSAAKAIRLLGGAPAEIRRPEYALGDAEGIVPGAERTEAAAEGKAAAQPGENGHIFVIVRKISATPSSYPRAGGKPRKDPL